MQSFLPEARLLVDVVEMVRTADHPHVRQKASEVATTVRVMRRPSETPGPGAREVARQAAS